MSAGSFEVKRLGAVPALLGWHGVWFFPKKSAGKTNYKDFSSHSPSSIHDDTAAILDHNQAGKCQPVDTVYAPFQIVSQHSKMLAKDLRSL